MSKTKLLLSLSIIFAAGSAVFAGVGTYKAYPKLKDAKEQGLGFLDTVKLVYKDYIPAAGALAGAGAVAVASGLISESDIRSAKGKFDQASRLYKDLSSKRATEISSKSVDISSIPQNDVIEIHDPISEAVFKTTRLQLSEAFSIINRKMLVFGGVMYSDFYKALGYDLPQKFKTLGWSYSTAAAMWVEPFVSCLLVSDEEKRFNIYYISTPQCSNDEMPVITEGESHDYLMFDPVENPESEDWV